jgi:hypothetical protein
MLVPDRNQIVEERIPPGQTVYYDLLLSGGGAHVRLIECGKKLQHAENI